MEVLKLANSRNKCTLVLEATEASQPFEKRVVTVRPGTNIVVGRMFSKDAFSLNRTLLFENKIISKRHAAFIYDGGKFFLKDLGSSNGTYLNEVLIGDGESNPAPKAVEVKTGDIVRFGESRMAYATNEVCQAIVGRLILIHPRTIINETEGHDTVKSFTPFEGYREHEQSMPNANDVTLGPTKCKEKKSEGKMPPELVTCHQETETESIVTSACETQTAWENDASIENIKKESQAHALSLWKAVVLAMAVIVGYQMYLMVS